MLKQIFIINKSLGMRAGKVAVQVAHGETLYMEDIQYHLALFDANNGNNPSEMLVRYEDWRESHIEPIGTMAKIVKRAGEQELQLILSVLNTMKNIKYYEVYDLGKTQVKKGSLTCIVIEPLEEKLCDELFGGLKLY